MKLFTDASVERSDKKGAHNENNAGMSFVKEQLAI
jgi:hypothetical protein